MTVVGGSQFFEDSWTETAQFDFFGILSCLVFFGHV